MNIRDMAHQNKKELLAGRKQDIPKLIEILFIKGYFLQFNQIA
jgi:hypothetical protein